MDNQTIKGDLDGGRNMNQPVNVLGITEYYEGGMLECVYEGWGYKNKDGNITWYEGYEPRNDEFHLSFLVPYGNGADLEYIMLGKDLAKEDNHMIAEEKDHMIVKEVYITKDKVAKAMGCLIDNGIDPDEAENVLQALGYALIDTELENLF